MNYSTRFENITTLINTFNNFRRSNLFMGGRILKGFEYRLCSHLSLFLVLKPISYFFGVYMACFFLSRDYWSLSDHDLMASIWEKNILILAENLNSGRSYLITTIQAFLIARFFWNFHKCLVRTKIRLIVEFKLRLGAQSVTLLSTLRDPRQCVDRQ